MIPQNHPDRNKTELEFERQRLCTITLLHTDSTSVEETSGGQDYNNITEKKGNQTVITHCLKMSTQRR